MGMEEKSSGCDGDTDELRERMQVLQQSIQLHELQELRRKINAMKSIKELENMKLKMEYKKYANTIDNRIKELELDQGARRRRLMNRLLRYENHYSSGAEGYPPRAEDLS